MKELKKQLTEDIIIPLKDPSKAKYNEKHYGIKMPNGILFYGPPGCGKTTIVERLSVETGLPLLELTTDSFGSEYINGSEINLGAVFDYAASIASEEKPVILFIDDVDGIVGTRNAFMHDHKKSELSVFLKRVQDAPKNNIIVMAATNNYDGIDKAFTSRLRQQIYTGLPDKDARKSIIKLKLEETDNGQNLAKDEQALDKIAELTESFPIRALEDFATETRKMAFINGIRDITLEDYETVISKPESQNKKIKEQNFKTNATRPSIGFGK
jgi:transitional endoplasmic reticulum ATPase